MSVIPFKACGLVTLTTDFGLSDPYVGIMKGAILVRHPSVRLVDLTHQTPVFQPEVAGFWLARSWQYFPTGTVHLAVVDPGVGTERAMRLLFLAGQLFIAPDNGLLDPVFRSAPAGHWRVFRVEDLVHLSLTPSMTFHGRDIFAPLVAEITANRQSPEMLGKALETMPAPVIQETGAGQIIYADHYGNLITDVAADCLTLFRQPVLQFRDQQFHIRASYGFAAHGELLGLVNSWGTLEIARAHGNAQRCLQAEPGEVVRVVEAARGAG
ncbi:MAG: S-adenosyl-l-methionine hydroxide adenosyltransferase family protein [Steroidobacteraceae bacterium]